MGSAIDCHNISLRVLNSHKGMVACTVDPVVEKTWRKRQSWRHGRQSLFWCFVNFVFASVMYYEVKFNTIGSSLEISHPLLYYTESILAVVFLMNAVTNLFVYVKPYFSTKYVDLSEGQKKLLAVKDTDVGFRMSPTKSPMTLSSDGSFMLSSTPSGQSSFSLSPSPRTVGHMTPTNLGSFNKGSMNYGNSSFTYGSPSTSYDRITSISALNTSAPYGAHNTSFSPNVSMLSPNMSYSPGTSFSPGTSSLHNSLDNSGLRSRANRHSLSTSLKNSPASSFDQITDQHSLSQYLKEQDERDYKTALSSSDMSATGGTSFWSYGRSAMDYTYVLKKYMYQLASRSPQSLTARSADSDQSTPFGGEDVWSKRGVTEDDLYLWTERLRKWFSQTVITRLAREIDEVNTTLRRIGSEDTEIGEVGVSTLKQLALTKGAHVPSLNAVVPYLDFSSNQEYLVKRIKELGKDGCMSDFCWHSGGSYGKPWGEHLPTDAGIVIHLFCTYLDSRLPPQPKYPDGKTFTTPYFVKTPDKPNLEKDDTLCIYQSTVNPPHFQVVIGKSIKNLPKGRNNMFHAILLFLHHIHKKEHGMLGRVNLGMSGVNVLWIFN